MEMINNEDSETLDVLYTEYLSALRDVVLRIENEEDINLCKQWLQVFNESSSEQKVARNCLIALLYQQLKSNECLSDPFTDLSNIGRDFFSILHELGIECGSSSKRSALESISSTSHHEETRGNLRNSPRLSSRSDTSIIPKASNHLKQIDDLNKFISNMKEMNNTFQMEIRLLRKEKEILQIKNERKNQEMQKLLNVVKDCNGCKFVENNILKLSNVGTSKKDIFQIYPIPDNDSNKLSKEIRNTNENFSNSIEINENEIFQSLNILIANLKAISIEENPLENITDINFSTFTRIFENCSNVSFLTRIVLYENNIQNLLLHIIQSVKNYYTNQIKLSNENIKDSKSGEQNCEKVLSKASQTKNIGYKISKGNSEYVRNSSEKLKIIYLRKCLLKMQNSRDKVVEKYENKIREQILQNKIQQKIMRLKLASIASKIFLQSNYKNQEELFQLANQLEAKYKDIVVETINKMESNA